MTVHHTVLTCNNAALAREVSPVRHLSACHPPLADLIRRIGPCRLIVNRQRSPYEALVRAIAHQQLHGRAAEAILARLLAPHAAESFISPQRLIDTDPAVLRACGFSAKKVAALQDIAAQTISGLVPTRAAAARMSNDELVERLTTLRGVGRWTVEMLLIFTLGRPDVLPVDDFGVREGWRRINHLDRQPSSKDMHAVGQAWAPYRSTAAWYLWRAADEAKRRG